MFINLVVIFKFWVLEKNFLRESIWEIPIPSIDWSSSTYLDFISFNFFVIPRKFFALKKCFANTFAFSWPIWRIPNEKIKRSNEIFLLLIIEFFKFTIDFLPHPSNFFNILKSKLKISYEYWINPFLQKLSITFFPSPSILKASLETKCFFARILYEGGALDKQPGTC